MRDWQVVLEIKSVQSHVKGVLEPLQECPKYRHKSKTRVVFVVRKLWTKLSLLDSWLFLDSSQESAKICRYAAA